MRISFASEQGQGRANEDRVCAGGDWALVIDGATAVPGVDSGCRHGVSWMVDRLCGALAAELSAERPAPLADCLAAAIAAVGRAHGGECDLENPDSPSAAVALARPEPSGGAARGAARRVEYLVLADCTVLLAEDGAEPTAVTDDRVDHLPGGRPYSAELVRANRNAEGGFWVAGAVPEAAYRAVTGVSRRAGAPFALMTDGCARLAAYYGHSWRGIWRRLEAEGPESLVSWVRAEERDHGVPGGKLHDDATAAVGVFGPAAARPPR
ncbi:protein phosphatase 2C domain-containing protein [Streptomonospora sp. PA3]|uniref:protein phosphatase 2C domain-containing protein n=1 Tax=Streptomonospora sp. PA3 TaxID=2607326 RepID=UPI001308C189|nr:protein phosphatase 2C domain-containing protein [Streptomonospora sp. PA3]